MDAAGKCREAAHEAGFEACAKALAKGGGRSVDVEPRTPRKGRERMELISTNFAKPSIGLEPMTPSLPSASSYGWMRVKGGSVP